MHIISCRSALRSCAAALVLLACLAGPALAYEALTGPTGVLKYVKGKAFEGYTLFAPSNSKTTYLINNEGDVVHTWVSEYNPGLHAVLLENGHLLRAGRVPKPPVTIGGVGGIIQEFDWDGKLVWEYKLFSPTEVQHHTFYRMPNGNTLIEAWERKTPEEAIAKGRDPKTAPKEVDDHGNKADAFWIDFTREVDKGGHTVWEWHVWDHLGTGPNQLDFNRILPIKVGEMYHYYDYSHINTVQYLPKTDQVLLNSRNLSEFYLINHKTGAIEYRWGNTSVNGGGQAPSWYDDGDEILFGPHCSTMLDNGHVLIFDNGAERPETPRSRAVEMDPATGKIVWEYSAKNPQNFLSLRQGAVQRLPNGNTLITSSNHGHVFEVTPDQSVVWEFVNPVYKEGLKCVTSDEVDDTSAGSKGGSSNGIHRAYRYGPDYPGLKGRELSAKGPLNPGCPAFYKAYVQGATMTAPAAPTAPAPAKAVPEEEGPAMKAY